MKTINILLVLLMMFSFAANAHGDKHKGKGLFKGIDTPAAKVVLAFHEAIPNDTDTVFHKGSTKAAWLGNFAITIAVLMLMMFIAPLVSVTGVPGATSIFRIVMIVIFFPLLIKLLIRNRPETYTRDTVPTELLS